MKHLKLKISGKVQGVFFRLSAKKEADRLGLGGWVGNNDDGTVSIEVGGEDEKVEEFLRWCYNGPVGAQVENVEIMPGAPRGSLNEFGIKS